MQCNNIKEKKDLKYIGSIGGGSVANVALFLISFDHFVSLIGVIGKFLDELVVRDLKKNNVDLTNLVRVKYLKYN